MSTLNKLTQKAIKTSNVCLLYLYSILLLPNVFLTWCFVQMLSCKFTMIENKPLEIIMLPIHILNHLIRQFDFSKVSL